MDAGGDARAGLAPLLTKGKIFGMVTAMVAMYLLVFIFGLVMGSFLNVVVYRVLTGDSPFRGRSACPHCHKQIAWHDNIPLFSFLLLSGKCRHCHKKISWRYPVLELLTAILFVWWFGMGQFFFNLTQQPYTVVQPVFWLLIGIGLLSMFVADMWFGVLPDVFTVGLSVLAFLYRFLLTLPGIMQLNDFLGAVAAGLGAAGFFWLLIWITKGKGMGFGDVKLGLLMGLLLGWPRITVALFMAFLTGALTGIILILLKRKRFGQTIPFGPFLILGTVFALVWGTQTIDWYVKMLGL